MKIWIKIAETLLVLPAALIDWLISGVKLNRHNRNFFQCVINIFCEIWEL